MNKTQFCVTIWALTIITAPFLEVICAYYILNETLADAGFYFFMFFIAGIFSFPILIITRIAMQFPKYELNCKVAGLLTASMGIILMPVIFGEGTFDFSYLNKETTTVLVPYLLCIWIYSFIHKLELEKREDSNILQHE